MFLEPQILSDLPPLTTDASQVTPRPRSGNRTKSSTPGRRCRPWWSRPYAPRSSCPDQSSSCPDQSSSCPDQKAGRPVGSRVTSGAARHHEETWCLRNVVSEKGRRWPPFATGPAGGPAAPNGSRSAPIPAGRPRPGWDRSAGRAHGTSRGMRPARCLRRWPGRRPAGAPSGSAATHDRGKAHRRVARTRWLPVAPPRRPSGRMCSSCAWSSVPPDRDTSKMPRGNASAVVGRHAYKTPPATVC